MSIRLRNVFLVVLPLAAHACTGDGGSAAPSAASRSRLVQAQAAAAGVQLSEIHYDDVGTDTGEAIEIAGPAGTDVTGYQIVLYNGNGGGAYSSRTLAGTIPPVCGDRGVLVVSYPANGIQNGDPDGVALVDAAGTVIDLISYEGTLTATDGPAAGLPSIDIGVRENGEPEGQSLQRGGSGASGTWIGPIASTFGACNADGPPPPPVVASVIVAPASATITAGGAQAFTATARATQPARTGKGSPSTAVRRRTKDPWPEMVVLSGAD